MEKVVLPNDVLLNEVTRLLAQGRDVALVPKGNSMLPFIHGDHDSVVLRRRATVEVGDIVLARFGGRYVLHRVIAVEGTKVTLMGDGNLKGVEQGDMAEVCGTVIEIVSPDGRRRKPTKGRLWRHLLPVRRHLLKLHRKWRKLFGKPL